MSAKDANNVWMKDKEKEEGKEVEIDRKLAYNEWSELYHTLANQSLVYTLPSKAGLQDQVYTANLGIVLPHLEERTFVLSKFKSLPRVGEEQVGLDFFKMMDFNIYQPETFFEGEAELKFIRDNIYIGGYGQRSDKATYEWMEKEFDMKIIKVKMTDEYLYHLDCMVFPINVNTVLACTELMEEEDIAEIEKVAEIVDVDADLAYNGICNSARCYGAVLQYSNLEGLHIDDENYEDEKRKVETTIRVCEKYGFEPMFFDLSQGVLSGAMLSCNILRLNYVDYQHSNV